MTPFSCRTPPPIRRTRAAGPRVDAKPGPAPTGRPRLSLYARALLLCAALAPAWSAQAAPDDERVAIQGHFYQMAHELRLSAGVMPLNAFEKGWTASLSYTVHFSNTWAWEIFQVTGAVYQAPTGLEDELVNIFGVSKEDFAPPLFMATTGMEWTPLYGKMSFLNDGIQHHALLLGAYGGVVIGDRDDMQESLKDIRPTAGLGLGYRWFLSKTWSLRADIRDYLSYRTAKRGNEEDEVENLMLITISISLNMGRDDA